MPFGSFYKDQPIDSPQSIIYHSVFESLSLVAAEDFINLCIVNIVTNVTSLSVVQKGGIKLASRSLSFYQDPTSIDSLLMFILYGTFENIGADEFAGEPLTVTQREEILQQIFNTAKSIIQSRIDSLSSLTNWTYESPDWIIPVE